MIKIEELAKLAKLNLSQEELILFSQQMPDIIKFVDILRTVEISNQIEPKSYISNVWREDQVLSWDSEEREVALNQGLRESGFVVSPKIR